MEDLHDQVVREREAKLARYKVMDELVAKHQDLLINLYDRWQDEKEYEDFAEYAKVMKEAILVYLPSGGIFVRASKRPFGFVVQMPGFPYKAIVSCNGSSLRWRQE